MPYSMQNLPPQVKNKPKDQQEAFVEAFNSSLSKGRSEEEAWIAGLGAMKRAAGGPVKKSLSVNRQINKPSHVPVFKEAPKEELQEEVKKALTLPAFLAKHSLPEGDRNILAMNFDSDGRLVVAFDTGEIISTDAVAIQEIIEQHIGVSVGGGGRSSAEPGQILYNEYTLVGEFNHIKQIDHGLSEILSFYITDHSKRVVEMEVAIESNLDIKIKSLIHLVNFTLHLTGISA